MLLYFSSEKNRYIFSKIDEDVKIENTNYFSEYINKNMNSLNHLDFLVIDLDYIVDEEDEIISSLHLFKSLNKGIEIIIVAIGRIKGDLLLGKLFYEDIYNFITSEDDIEREKEVIACINKENNYSTALCYKVEETKFNQEIENKSFFNNLGNIFKNKKNNKEQVSKVEKIKYKNKKQKKEIYNSEKDDYLEVSNNNFVEEIEREFKQFNNNFEEIEFEEIETEEKTEKEEIKEIKINQVSNNIEKTEKINKKLLDEEVNEIFGNTNFVRQTKQKHKRKLELEYIDNMTALFYYYQKVIGLYSKDNNTCVIDSIFEKDDIKDYLKDREINYIFKDNILEKVKSLENKLKGGGYQN